jgi:hypothetical protein
MFDLSLATGGDDSLRFAPVAAVWLLGRMTSFFEQATARTTSPEASFERVILRTPSRLHCGQGHGKPCADREIADAYCPTSQNHVDGLPVYNKHVAVAATSDAWVKHFKRRDVELMQQLREFAKALELGDDIP